MSPSSSGFPAHAPSIVNPDGTTNRIWLSSYVQGVPADIDLNKYKSMNQYFDECINKFRERTAFVSIGTEMSYGRLETLVNAFCWLAAKPGRQKGDRVAIMSPNLFQYPFACSPSCALAPWW